MIKPMSKEEREYWNTIGDAFNAMFEGAYQPKYPIERPLDKLPGTDHIEPFFIPGNNNVH